MAVTRAGARPRPLGALEGWVPPSQQRPTTGPPGRILLLLGLVGVAGVMLALAGEIGAATSETWAAIIVAAILLAISVPIAAGAARRDNDPLLAWILIGSAAAKLFGGFARYSLSYTLNYSNGRTDANGYYNTGLTLADEGFELGGRIVGTRFIELLSGVIYTVIPPSRMAGFFVFAFLSWIGLFFFTRAFRIAFPNGNFRRYDALVLFLPSMLFWPSSIGKEAWMTLTIGITAYGAARLLAQRHGGYPILALGLWGTAMVRPHITLILALSVLVAYPVRRSAKKSTTAPITKTVGFGVMILLALVVASQAQAFFHADSLEPEAFSDALVEAQDRSSTGGSEFAAQPVRSIRDIPGAFIDVPFRPFPWEASDWMQLMAALEGLVLIVLFIRAAPRLLHLPREMLRRPYLMFAVVYSAGFAIAFSTISNFGILVRQRVQLIPLFLILIIPLGERVKSHADDGDPEPATPTGASPSSPRPTPARRTRAKPTPVG